MKKHLLIDTFNYALEYRKGYVGVAIETRGMEKPEYIINSYPNIAQKLAYYMGAYNDDLVLKSYDGIRITMAAAANTIEDLIRAMEVCEEKRGQRTITIIGTEAETDYMIDCMIGNCEGCKAWDKCKEETQQQCGNCNGGKTCGECIEEGKSCGEMIRESINIIVEE